MVAPVISFSGLATGIDTAKMVQQLVQLERLPIRQLQDKQADLRTQEARFNDLKNLLGSVQTAAQAIDTSSEFLASSVTTTDATVLTATATGDASLGTYGITVNALAQAERSYTSAFSARDATGLFGTGTFTVQVTGETAKTITVDASSTLDSVASAINASGAGVTAGIISTTLGYRLQVSGNNTGASQAIAFDETGMTGTPLGFVEKVAAQDASITVDTYTVTSSTNSITTAIPGVTLDLLKSGSSASVKVQRDSTAIEARAKTFVDAYNRLMTKINAEFTYTGKPKGPDSLVGDSTLRSLQTKLRSLVTSEVSGLTGTYKALSQLGITSSKTGELSLSSTKFQAALAADPSSVSKVFIDDTSGGGTTGVMTLIDDMAAEYLRSGDGTIATRVKGIGTTISDISSRIANMQLRIDAYELRLRTQFSSMAQLVSGLQAQGQQMLSMLNNQSR